jgi:hypothetical protein
MRFRVYSNNYMKPFVIVNDYKFYIANEQEIKDWASQCTPGWAITGMVLEFKNEQDRLAFLLRWN